MVKLSGMVADNDSENFQRWAEVVSDRSRRVGEDNLRGQADNPRNQYQRDFDRLIFSSAFKRLQKKTQVFPLPGTAQVHNRLTHSLEVSSVGRSLGSLVGGRLAEILEKEKYSDEVVHFYRYELKDVILAACLAHDLGNPCFGHSGESIISDYFTQLRDDRFIKGRVDELNNISEPEWADLTRFEGNANTLRILITHYHGKLSGGLRLTYLTLASIIKYPWSSAMLDREEKHPMVTVKGEGGKYGFFHEQADLVEKIASALNLHFNDNSKIGGEVYRRHPFVYLVEAADDICYNIMDMEDAQRLSIISTDTVMKHFWELYREVGDAFFPNREDYNKIKAKEDLIGDEREKVVFLRSKCINILTEAAAEIFMENREDIGNGEANDLLTLMSDKGIKSFKKIKDFSVKKIYNHRTVSEVMVGASQILPDILDWFLPAILSPDKGEHNKGEHNYREKKIFSLINPQYSTGSFDEFKERYPRPYTRILILLDFLSGMTDEYITEWYRKLKGMEIPKHS